MRTPIKLALFLVFAIAPSSFGLTIPGHVMIKLPESDEDRAQGFFNNYFCGGVKVGTHTYLVASHCTKEAVPAAGKIEVGHLIQFSSEPSKSFTSTVSDIQFPQGTLEVARTIKCDDYGCDSPNRTDWKDLALVRVTEENEFPIAQIAESASLSKGDRIFVSGSELAMGVVFLPGTSEATVRTVQNNVGSATLMGTHAVVNPGDSGSPIWIKNADGTYRIVGITSFMENYQRVGFTLLNESLAELFSN